MEQSFPGLTVECAPMEGVTRAMFRTVHKKMFTGVSRYYSPFLAPSADGVFSTKELREILPENNENVLLVPQLLTGRAEHFAWASKVLKELGYDTVNLNLGCPSGTVVAKHKGSGLLADTEELERLLEGVSEAAAQNGQRLSVKTRIGLESAELFPQLMEVFNQFPLEELIIHPRIRRQFYKGTVDREAFRYGLEHSRNPVCYNGDLFTVSDVLRLKEDFPAVDKIMLGRGLIADPALARRLAGGAPLTDGELRAFHDSLLEGYCAQVQGEVNILHKMKELWTYFGAMFPEGRRFVKEICKARTVSEYRLRVDALFGQCVMDPQSGFSAEN